MVRLVFRPYTQVRKAICTSAHLRASTRVSSGFTLLRHSSPSFGSQRVYSYSHPSHKLKRGRCCRHRAIAPVRFLALRGGTTHQLAYTLDSLVRVSRRADETPSASITRAQFQMDSESALTPRSDGRQDRRIKPRACTTHPTHADQLAAHSTRHQGGRVPASTRGVPSLPSQQFQVLFNSLFKVLFIFPSRYLFAIGLPSVFSLRWDLPPD